jgi:hypothetical protein
MQDQMRDRAPRVFAELDLRNHDLQEELRGGLAKQSLRPPKQIFRCRIQAPDPCGTSMSIEGALVRPLGPWA